MYLIVKRTCNVPNIETTLVLNSHWNLLAIVCIGQACSWAQHANPSGEKVFPRTKLITKQV